MRRCFTVLAVAVALTMSADRAAYALTGVPFGPSVVGVVKDSTGAPLPSVQVVVAEVGRTTTTGPDGKFTLRGLPAGEYHMNSLLVGYRPGHVVVTGPEAGSDVSVSIVMAATPMRLQSVSVTASPRHRVADGDGSRFYRSRPDLALSSHPKSMAFMEGQGFSLAFRREAPKFNGLISRAMGAERMGGVAVP